MKLDFCVVGAAKSGTTAIHYCLNQYREISLPTKKETNYFCCDQIKSDQNGPGDARFTGSQVISSIDEYRLTFAQRSNSTDEVKYGEVCPSYLYFDKTAQRLFDHNPNMIIYCILRNPIQRAFSHYLHLVRDEREKEEKFEDALDLEQKRKGMGWEWSWRYTEVGQYFSQLKNFFDVFPRDKIHIYLYDDFDVNNEIVVHDIINKLGIHKTRSHPKKIYNASGKTTFKNIGKILYNPVQVKTAFTRLLPPQWRQSIKNKMNSLLYEKQYLSNETSMKMYSSFSEDIIKLEKLTGLDLSRWKRLS